MMRGAAGEGERGAGRGRRRDPRTPVPQLGDAVLGSGEESLGVDFPPFPGSLECPAAPLHFLNHVRSPSAFKRNLKGLLHPPCPALSLPAPPHFWFP